MAMHNRDFPTHIHRVNNLKPAEVNGKQNVWLFGQIIHKNHGILISTA